jgi:predicted dehydrogenase
MQTMFMNRRQFTKTLAALSTTAALSQTRIFGANERVRLGFIGVGNRGDQVLDGFLKQPDAQVVAVCDIYQPYREFAAQKAGGQPKQFADYRKLLELKDLDAVVIATPDHWHALQTIEACLAGKDVYVEKPICLRLAEGRAMVEAVKAAKRVCQSGLHRRSSAMCRQMAEFVRNGGLGKITGVRTFHIQNEWPKGIGNPADSAPPAGLDWEAWMGPAPKRAYNRNRALYKFRWFFDYTGGQITNNGIHYLDLIQWALGQPAPLSVTAMGGHLAVEDNRDTPDTMEALWQYPGGTLVTFTQFNANGAGAAAQPCEIEFRGTKGTLYFRSSGWEVVPEKITGNEFPQRSPVNRALERGWRSGEAPQIEPKKVTGRAETADHARNFLDCIKSRAMCNSDLESAHRSTSATLIANISMQTKSYLEWDAQAEQFTNNAAANKLLRYDYRPPLRFPEPKQA